MMDKETIKNFLKPDWKKFILPIILIILFFVVINSFYTCGSIMNEYGCEIASLQEGLMHDIEQNNTYTLAFNQTRDKILLKVDVFQKKLSDNREHVNKYLNFIKNIDPVVPIPCEIIFEEENNCVFYMTEDTYNCITRMLNFNSSTDFLFEKPEIAPYRNGSVFNLGLNILILFFEGYLFSCLIIFVWNKFRKRKQ